jgi:hypothetical protein
MKTRKIAITVCILVSLCILMMGCGKQEVVTTDDSEMTSEDKKIVNDIKKDIPQNATKSDIYKDKDGNFVFNYEAEDGTEGGGMVLK